MSDQKHAAPVPRDYDAASFSEMVPFRSKKIKLHKSPLFYFVVATAGFNVLLFGLRVAIIGGPDVESRVAAFDLMVQVALFYMLALAVLGLHAYAKTDKPMLYYVFPALFIYAFMHSLLWHFVFVPFNVLGQGNLFETSPDFPVRLYSAIAGPGMREELVKGLPMLIGVAISLAPGRFGALPPWLANLLRIRTPLDGLLMGFAAGAAFLFAETGGEYVHNALNRSLQMSKGNLAGAFGDGLMLLLPRVMNGWVGHMAWSGIVGYALGLAVLRPRQGWKIAAGGYLAAAILHGAWDSSAPGGLVTLVVIGAAGGLLAIACLMKARQLEASIFGRSMETSGSIVVGAPGAPPRPAPPMQAPPMQAPVHAPSAQAAAPPPALVAQGIALAIGAVRLPLQGGAHIDLAAQPGLADLGQGVLAEVTRHPTKPDVLGLKNLGQAEWQATLRDGSVQPVQPQRSLRLAPGLRIDFGTGLVGHVVAA